MKRLIQILCCFCTLLLLNNVSAQDPHFSQFFSSPLTLNPAFTGKFTGDFRVAGNYRNQWPSINNAYTTATVSIDFPVLANRIANNDTWGLGVVGYNDNSANGAVKFNYASLSTAYHKGLDEDGFHQLGAGFQLTYANMLINTNELKFEDQLTNAGFTGVTSEVFNNGTLKSSYLDVNAGVLYNGSTSERNNFYFGVSMYHINRPRQNFTNAQYLLNPRTTIHAGGSFPVGISTSLHLSALQMFQGGASETMLGGALQFSSDPDDPNASSLYAGSWLRLNDAIVPYLGLEFNNFRIGISYDYNSSALKTASQNRGGIELSLIYTRRPSNDRSIRCPKF